MASEDVLKLRQQVCFALYAASRAVTALYRPELDRMGVTYPQYLVLLVLWEHGDTTVKELGTALMLDSGTLSPLLKRLESRALVTRRRSDTDERSVVIALTEAGERLRHDATCVPVNLLDATGLPPAEVFALRDAAVAFTEAVVAAQQQQGGTT